MRKALDPGVRVPPPTNGPPLPPRSLADKALLQSAWRRPIRKRFHDAWVLMDRIADADDSAEVLFRWIREHRPQINAWFVVSKESPDFERLRRDGYKRVIAYGSPTYWMLMLNAVQLISSHADRDVVEPERLTRLVRRTWRTAFLNHGVIKDDLSGWLNPKDFDIFVTSTPGEYASVAGDGTGYHYSDRDTTQSGMPRFDQLLEAARGVPEEQQSLLLLAPTWRNWLVDTSRPDKPPLPLEQFLRTDFAVNWLGLASSEEVKETAERNGLQVAMLLHPNLQPMREQLALPDHVLPLSFEGGRIRETFARARMMVTDYSSMAFNAAYLDRPVVYFQFDRERVMSGGHLGRAGYFEYERDGFGPVSLSLTDAVEAVRTVADAGRAPMEPYATRIRETFPQRDGRCTERTFAAIEASMREVSRTPVVLDRV